MRLAFLADPKSVHSRRWIGFFAERGHDVHLLISERDVLHPDLNSSVAVHRYRRFGPWRLPFFSSLQGGRALRELLARINPHILHAHNLSGYGWQARLAGFHPYVVTVWGSDIFETPDRSVRERWWARQTLGSADLVTVMTEDMRAKSTALGARPHRIASVQFGVDTDRFTPGPPDPGLANRLGIAGRRVVFSPRAIKPLYRHEIIAQAVAELEADVVLVMGTRHADLANLYGYRRLVTDLGLADRVLILDEIADADMVELYRLANVVVSVPNSDGLPLSVLEAMACGRPLVVSDLPGLRELLGGDMAEYMVPAGDAPALGAALKRALALPANRRDAMGRQLRQVVVDAADYRTNMLLMENHYRRLIAEGPRAGGS
jgi:glycosyltransferase involved in cell wall biosynthesis